MRNLDDFMFGFKNENKDVPHFFSNTIKNFSPKSKESRKINMKMGIVKKSIVITATVFLCSGVAFAANQAYENIWKQPETYEITNELTEEDKKNAISEEEARKKASDYLTKIGLEDEITELTLHKDAYKDELMWNIGFTSGSFWMDEKGNFRSLNIPSYNYTIPYNYGITREDARVVAKQLLSKYNPNNNDDEYELVEIRRNMETDIDSYIWYATFYKKYGDLLNKYEKIHIGWVPTINGLYSLSIENSEYENNEQVISKEEAIKIATEKDKQIETRYNIASVEAEIGIDKMNTEVVYREKDIEGYDNGTINFERGEDGKAILKDDAVFYKVENRVRKVWEVTIYYDYVKYEENGPVRYVYFVDSTTGEIIGGGRGGANIEIKQLKEDPYNFIEK